MNDLLEKYRELKKDPVEELFRIAEQRVTDVGLHVAELRSEIMQIAELVDMPPISHPANVTNAVGERMAQARRDRVWEGDWILPGVQLPAENEVVVARWQGVECPRVVRYGADGMWTDLNDGWHLAGPPNCWARLPRTLPMKSANPSSIPMSKE